MPPNPPAPRSRDRAATEEMLVKAAREVLASDGFQGLGINAVARQAGCDKQLIYRYFGGLDGLVDAIGTEIADDLRRSLQPTSVAQMIKVLNQSHRNNRVYVRLLTGTPGAVVNGDITAGSLTVAAGARMRGQASFGWDEGGGKNGKRPDSTTN